MIRITHYKRIAFLSILYCILFSSCISRLSRPEISGVIVDYNKKPIENCKVGETLTNKDGRFRLPEKRYNAFLLTEMFMMEAPPLMVYEAIEKEGFEKDAISIFNKWGGGKSKGTKANVDTVYLKKVDQQFKVEALLKNSQWNLAFTKHGDTIYLVKEGFEKWCKTERCSPFYNEYNALTDNYYSGSKNLPEGMIKRFVVVNFNESQEFKMQVAQQYKSTFEGEDKKPDTLNTTGNFKLTSQNKIQLNVKQMKNISGLFKLSEIDLYQLKLTKTP